MLLLACDAGGPAPGVTIEIRADRAVYAATSGDVHIDVGAVNVSDRTVYYECNGFQHTLERREDETWVEIGSWYLRLAVACYPRRLEPGEAVLDLPPITRLRVGDFALSAGTYRVRSEFFEDERQTVPVPSSEVVSVPFEIR
ncbi:hypothetical protein [Rubrivirga sp.]|uniref:hypothetical protein n=1 Tax=Rubrivirga sp. TaxID=1885344 RepID=UPI003B524D67